MNDNKEYCDKCERITKNEYIGHSILYIGCTVCGQDRKHNKYSLKDFKYIREKAMQRVWWLFRPIARLFYPNPDRGITIKNVTNSKITINNRDY